MIKVASEHINAQLNGWRTADGIILREPITASFAYTPALAKCAPLPPANPYIGHSCHIYSAVTMSEKLCMPWDVPDLVEEL